MPQLTSRPLVGRSREAASRSHRYNSSDETDRIQNNGRIKVNVSRAYDKSESTERMRNTGSASQASPGRGAAMSQTERNDEVALMLSHPAHAALDKHRSRVDKFNSSQRSGLSKLDGSHKSLHSTGSVYSHHSASSALSGKSTSRRRRTRWFPRVDLWLLLATTQIVSLGTLASSSSSYSQRTSTEEGVLAIASMTFILSLGVGAGMLHRPFRRYLTSLAPPPVYNKEDRPRRRVKGIREMVTPEQLLSLLALVLTCVTSGMMLQPSSELAVAGSEVWNPNLFYASWIGLYGNAYLVATLMVGSLGNAGVQLRRWFLLLFSSICAASSLLVASSGSACEGTLGDTGYCHRATAGGLLSVATASVALACGTFLARAARRTQGYTHGSASTTSRTRVISLIASSILLVLQMTTVGLATSPSGPGYDIGSIFLTTWTTLVLSLLLWKGSIDAFLITPTPAVATLKTLEKQHRRSLHSSGMSHDTGSTDDEESQDEPEIVLDDLQSYRFSAMGSAMGDSKSREASVYEASKDDSSYGSESTPSQGEVIRCLESLGERRGAAYDRPDPEESSYEKKVSDPDSASIPASYVKRGSDPDTDPEEGYDAKYDTTYEYEAPESGARSRTGSETDYSGYYSGSQAVQVRTGNQEDVSTLGGTLDALSRARSYGDLTKSRSSTPARSRSRSRSRPKAREAEAPLQREKSRRFADPFAEESKRKMSNFTMSSKSSELVDQEWEFDDYGAPMPQPQPPKRSERQERHHQEHRVQQSPLMAKPTLVPTAMNDGPHTSPAALAAAAIAAAELRQQQAQAPPLGAQAQHALAQQQQQGQQAPQGLSRRASKSSLMSVLSNLSPLEEGTEEEGSSRPQTVTGKSVAESTISTKSRISVPSGKERRLRRQKSGEGRDRDPKREIKAASKGRSRTQPPPPPRQTTKGGSKQKKPSRRSPVVDDKPSGKKSPTASLEEKKPSEGSSTLPRTIEPEPKKPSEGSSTIPGTVDGQVGLKKPSDGSSDIRTIPPMLGERPQRRRSNTDDSGSLSTSSSDFDIVVPSTQSVVTELTQDGFDVPETIPEARMGGSKGKSKYASHAAEAADNYNSFHKSGGTARKSPRSKKSPHTKAKKAQAKAALPEGLPGKMPLYNGTPSVSEQSNATRSPNTASNSLRGQEVHPSVEAFLATAMKQARLSRSYGNVHEDDIPLTDEEEDSEVVRAARREARGQSQRSDDRRKKRPSPSTSKPTRKPVSKSPRGRNKAAAYSRSEPELLRDEALLDAASDDEKYRSKSPDAVLEGMLAEQATPADSADVGRDGLTEQERRESMQSFFSEADEDGTFLTSPGEDYVC